MNTAKRSDGAKLKVIKRLFLALVMASSLPAMGATATRTSSFTYESVTGLLISETVEPDQQQFRVDTTYAYDAFGNKISVTVSSPATGLQAISSRTSTTAFDADGQFPVSSTNALGHTETKIHDPYLGAVTSLTGPNGLTTQWQYDDFGRKTREIRADGTQTVWTYEPCDAACPANGAYRIYTQVWAGSVKAAPTSVEYFDQLGRKIRNAVQAFDGRWTYTDTVYDELGRKQKVSRPYFAGGEIHWVTSEFDELDRVVRVYEPDDLENPALVAEYDGLSVSRTNRKGQTTTETKDSQGQKISVTDAAGNLTSYAYDPFGNLTRVVAPGSVVTTNTYDLRGRKTQTSDPDLGVWTYEYNALGELVKQTDAKAQATTMTYDKLGRMTQRVEAGMTSNWVYDTSPTRGIGKLHQASTNNGYLRTHTYDNLGRALQTSSTLGSGGPLLATSVSYDSAGRTSTNTYPSGLVVKQVYNATGYLAEVRNGTTDALYWRLDQMDAEGHVVKETYGNGVVTERGYQADNGRLQNIVANNAGGQQIQGHAYVYDTIGNVTTLADGPGSQLEIRGGYDDLNRLTQINTTINGVATSQTLTYDALGNITSKTGVGSYSYGDPLHRHAVTQAGSNSYSYDANGNLTGGGGRSVNWTAWNMPSSISSGGLSQSWSYDPEHSRYKMVTSGRTTWYLNPSVHTGGHYERTQYQSGTIEHRHTLYGGGAAIGEVLSFDGGAPSQTRYFHSDQQGSITAVTDQSGTVITRFRYDPWGKQTLFFGSNAGIDQTRQGHTAHEMLDNGLTHMNGRLYDPVLARFISADPFVDNPFDLQSLNRYSYVNNNPLGFTDPSGYFKIFGMKWSSFRDKVAKPVVAMVVSWYVGGAAAWSYYGSVAGAAAAQAAAAGLTLTTAQVSSMWITAQVVGGAVGGFTGGLISSEGNIGAAFKGAISGAMLAGIDGHYGETWSAERVAAKGVAGGIASRLQGGKFAGGFWSSSVGAGFRYVYNSVVKYDVTPEPGGDAVGKDPLDMPDKIANNIGTAEKTVDPKSTWAEGGVVSRIANRIPTINAIAGIHDVFQIRLQEWGGEWARNILNVPGMPIAAGVTWAGLNDASYLSYDTIRQVRRENR